MGKRLGAQTTVEDCSVLPPLPPGEGWGEGVRPRRSRYFRPQTSTAALVALATLLSIIYVTLAIVAFGGFTAFFSNPARVAISISLILFAAITPLCGCHIAPAIEEHRGNDWIFPPLLVLGLTMGCLSAWADRHNHWTIGGDGVRYFGLFLFLTGVVLRIVAIRTLGKRFSVWVAIQENHQLQTTGLYRFIRHPSYTGAMLNLLGWALVFRSIEGMLLAGAMSLLLVTRITAEEKLLIWKFGAMYVDYQKRSWKLIPAAY
jgi:protein-S-isoprenylcysteine O-methyltransferase Ste14